MALEDDDMEAEGGGMEECQRSETLGDELVPVKKGHTTTSSSIIIDSGREIQGLNVQVIKVPDPDPSHNLLHEPSASSKSISSLDRGSGSTDSRIKFDPRDLKELKIVLPSIDQILSKYLAILCVGERDGCRVEKIAVEQGEGHLQIPSKRNEEEGNLIKVKEEPGVSSEQGSGPISHPGIKEPQTTESPTPPDEMPSKRLKCKFCGKCVARMSNLRQHERIHTQNVQNVIEKTVSQEPVTADTQEQDSNRSMSTIVQESDNNNPVVSKPKTTKKRGSCYFKLKSKSFKCRVCNNKFRTRGLLTQHYLTQHKNGQIIIPKMEISKYPMKPPLVQNKISTVPTQRSRECSVCHKIFSTDNSLKTHLRIHTGEKPYACSDCGETFIRRDYVVVHQKTCPESIAKNHIGSYVKTLNRDEISLQGLALVSSIPEPTLKIPSNSRSKSIESPEKKPSIRVSEGFQCQFCPKVFKHNYLLKNHTKRHTGKRQRHMNTSGHRPFACQKCGYRFTSSAHLRRHVDNKSCFTRTQVQYVNLTPSETESPEKLPPVRVSGEFQCQLCPKVFKWNCELKRHTERHFNKRRINNSESRPFSCQKCGFKFKAAFHLQRHIKNKSCFARSQVQYVNPKPIEIESPEKLPSVRGTGGLQCRFCPKVFKQNYLLRKHIERHFKKPRINKSGFRPFSCQTCGFKFKLACNLKRHIENKSCFGKRVQYVQLNPSEPELDTPKTIRTRPGPASWKYMEKANVTKTKPKSVLTKRNSVDSSKKASVPPKPLQVREVDESVEKDKDEHELTFSCDLCGLSFDDLTKLTIHNRRVHNESKPFVCMTCGKEIEHLGNFRKHELKHVRKAQQKANKKQDQQSNFQSKNPDPQPSTSTVPKAKVSGTSRRSSGICFKDIRIIIPRIDEVLGLNLNEEGEGVDPLPADIHLEEGENAASPRPPEVYDGDESPENMEHENLWSEGEGEAQYHPEQINDEVPCHSSYVRPPQPGSKVSNLNHAELARKIRVTIKEASYICGLCTGLFNSTESLEAHIQEAHPISTRKPPKKTTVVKSKEATILSTPSNSETRPINSVVLGELVLKGERNLDYNDHENHNDFGSFEVGEEEDDGEMVIHEPEDTQSPYSNVQFVDLVDSPPPPSPEVIQVPDDLENDDVEVLHVPQPPPKDTIDLEAEGPPEDEVNADDPPEHLTAESEPEHDQEDFVAFCPHCGDSFHTPGKYRAHVDSHYDSAEYHCSACSSKFDTPDSLLDHIQTCDRARRINETNTGRRPLDPLPLKRKRPQTAKVLPQKRARVASTTTEEEEEEEEDPLGHLYHKLTDSSEDTRRRPYQCKKCQRKFTTLSQVKTHLKCSDHTCPHCSKAFCKFNALRHHLTKEHSDIVSVTPGFNFKDKPYSCYVCASQFSTQEERTQHVGQPKVNCPWCPRVICGGAGLDVHVKLLHPDQEIPTSTVESGAKPLFTCVHCQSGFWDSAQLNEHLKTHLGQQQQGQGHMTVGPESQGRVQVHDRSSVIVQPQGLSLSTFKCPWCPLILQGGLELGTHLNSVHSDKVNAGPPGVRGVSQSQPQSQSLTLVHTQTKNINCKHCKIVFTSWEEMSAHLKTHLNNLNRDVRTTTPTTLALTPGVLARLNQLEVSRPRSIPATVTSTATAPSTVSQQKSQVLPAPFPPHAFPCTACGRTFGQQANLRLHITLAHSNLSQMLKDVGSAPATSVQGQDPTSLVAQGSNVFPCWECGKCCSSEVDLILHRSMVHAPHQVGPHHPQPPPQVSDEEVQVISSQYTFNGRSYFFRCIHCGEQYTKTSMDEFRKHMAQKHPQILIERLRALNQKQESFTKAPPSTASSLTRTQPQGQGQIPVTVRRISEASAIVESMLPKSTPTATSINRVHHQHGPVPGLLPIQTPTPTIQTNKIPWIASSASCSSVSGSDAAIPGPSHGHGQGQGQPQGSNFPCPYCKVVCASLFILTLHTHQHSEGKIPYECKICFCKFVNVYDFLNHGKVHQPSKG